MTKYLVQSFLLEEQLRHGPVMLPDRGSSVRVLYLCADGVERWGHVVTDKPETIKWADAKVIGEAVKFIRGERR